MTYKIIFFSLLTFLFLVPPLPVHAQEAAAIEDSCVQINNGGDSCFQSDTLTINKKVLNPTARVMQGQNLTDNLFIENTNLKEPFTPANSLSAFRLYITNTSSRELKNITIVDTLPASYLTYVTSDGEYSNQNRTTTFTIDTLAPDQTKAFTIQIMTAMGMSLPSDPVCVTNQARARVTNERFFILPDEIKESQDNTRICITKNETGGTPLSQMNADKQQPRVIANTTTPTGTAQPRTQQVNPTTTKGGLPVMSPSPTNKTPDTGAEILLLLGLLPLGGLGYYLRHKTK